MPSLATRSPEAAPATAPVIDAPARTDQHRRPAFDAARQFDNMRVSYRGTGGIARVEELVDHFRGQGGPGPDALVAWIERRKVICFEWDEAIWLPVFQFHRVDLVPHPQLEPVFRELAPVFDAWETANWFASPNAWLSNRTPVSMLLSNLEAVRHAARADRFIANG